MSLTITKHPVTVNGSTVNNIFAGLSEISVGFKREDIEIITLGESAGKIEISVSGNLTSLINVGQSVYISSQGVTYDYNISADVISVSYSAPSSFIVLDFPFIQGASGGYMNYRRNYYVELQLIDTDTNINILGFSLTDDGKQNGDVSIDLSIANDLNVQTLLFDNGIVTPGAIEDSRVKCRFQYREVYEGSSNSFIVDDETLIIVYSRENPEIEEINSDFDTPRLYAGYPFFIDLFHSDSNEVGLVPKINYQQLDINKDSLGAASVFFSFSSSDFGQLMAIWNSDSFTINNSAKFIKFDRTFGALSDYSSDDYSSDYSII